MNQDAALQQKQPSRIRSITIFGVLVLASVSGAAFAQITAADPIPDTLGQPDTADISPSPLAFGQD